MSALRCCGAALLASVLIALLSVNALAQAPSDSKPRTPVHVAFLMDCTMYSRWQALGAIFSFKMSGQPGSVTNVLCCTEEEEKKYPKEILDLVDSHIAPSMTINPHNHDHYAAYNKPEAVIDWLEHVTPKEDFVLVLDSDMILRRPFFVETMGPKKGRAVGARWARRHAMGQSGACRVRCARAGVTRGRVACHQPAMPVQQHHQWQAPAASLLLLLAPTAMHHEAASRPCMCAPCM